MRKSGKVRIIGGQWKSRVLRFPTIRDLRPTPDSVRETLFNWLRNDIEGNMCLDLFAGSGALGFEAASRGAKQVMMIDNALPAVKALKENSVALGATRQIEVIKSDANGFVLASETQFDIVFIDPPYNSDIIGSICKNLQDKNLLRADAHIYIESPQAVLGSSLPIKWKIVREKKCGMVHSTLIKI